MRDKKSLLIRIIVLCLMMSTGIVFMSGCSSNTSDTSDTDQTTEQEITVDEDVDTIEKSLVILMTEGYKKTDEGYVYAEFADDVSSRIVLNADDNKLIANFYYNYGNDQNEPMKKFMKKQDEAVKVMVSAFLTRMADEADAEQASMDYSIYVAGEQVVSDTMSLEDAQYYQSLAIE